MKTHFTTLTLLTLLFLTSCGQQSSTNATLEVSQGFLASNAGFAGGLVVYGRHQVTGERLSLAIATGNSRTVNLPNGPWEFASVGWDGNQAAGPSNILMGGQARCGYSLAVLKGGTSDVNLEMSLARCTDPTVAGLFEMMPTNFKTCGAFYTKNGAVYDSLKATNLADFDCNADELPRDFLNQTPKFRLITLNLVPGSVPSEGFSSECLSTSAATLSRSLPHKSIPFIVRTYLDDNCTREQASFLFNQGLALGDSAQFDHLSATVVTNVKRILLPSTKTKRGYSVFFHLLPAITCESQGVDCLNIAEDLIPDHYIFNETSQEFAILQNVASDACSHLSLSVNSGKIAYDSCRVEDQQLRLRFSKHSSCTENRCSTLFSFTYKGSPLRPTIVWENANNFSNRRALHKLASFTWEHIGMRGDQAINDNFYKFSKFFPSRKKISSATPT